MNRGQDRLKILNAVRPNAGIEAHYRKKLRQLVEEMGNSISYWLEAAYKQNEPVLAQDELPAHVLRRAVRTLARRWNKRFDVAAKELAAYFTKSITARSDAALRTILADAGISVKFTMTRAMRDAMAAAITEQVGLIRSIPRQHFTQVEGMVMRSVQTGRDLGQLAKDLQTQFGVTKRRAAFIALDQNNKTTAVLTRVRQMELGINKAIWLHSHTGKQPRPTHLANHGKAYDVDKGWYDPDAYGKGKGAYIHPGELIRCRCVSRSVIPGL